MVACALAALVGCGGGDGNSGGGNPGGGTADYALGVAGTYQGSSTVNAAGSSSTSTVQVPVEYQTVNLIKLHGFCGAGGPNTDGPVASVSAGGAINIQPGSCTLVVGSCTTATLSVTSGSGQIGGGNLSLSFAGRVAGCGQSVSYSMTFSGPRVSGSSAANPFAAALVSDVLVERAGF